MVTVFAGALKTRIDEVEGHDDPMTEFEDEGDV
jgi:hypothetical protein